MAQWVKEGALLESGGLILQKNSAENIFDAKFSTFYITDEITRGFLSEKGNHCLFAVLFIFF